jgi:Ca2+-binding EF-hand superfamily protein
MGLMYTVTQLLSKKNRQSMEQIFIYLDKDADGSISCDDLLKVYKKLHKDKKGVKEIVGRIVEALDMNLNEHIDYSGTI